MILKRRPYKIVNILIALLFLSCFAFLSNSCDMLNTPVKDFFTEAAGGLSLSEKSTADNSSTDNTGTNTTDNSDNNSDETDDGGETTTDTPEINPGPVTPVDTEFDEIDSAASFVFYVSADGDDSNDGSKENPLQTIDKALSTLKANFQTDTTKNAGYVLLLSDIEITEEIKFQNYNFAELHPNVVKLTIAGYGAIRSIDAKSNCRIMKIEYTNGDLSFKNIKFTGGNNIKPDGSYDDVGGAALYVSSQGENTKKLVFCEINNCIFTDNMSTKDGAALALETDYSVQIKNCEFSNNFCYDGAAAVSLIQTYTGALNIISGTAIKNNQTYSTIDDSAPSQVYDYGYVINIIDSASGLSKLGISGVSIKDNSILQVSSSSSADYTKLCAVKNLDSVSGMNIIANNNVVLNGTSTEIKRNIVLDTTSGEKLSIVGDCTGSSIGIMSSENITAETVFTSGYTSKTSAVPASVFVCDGDYGIGYSSDGAEAAFVLNSGSFSNPFDYTVSFAVSPDSMLTGQETTFTVTPVVKKNGVLVSSSELTDITWSLSLSNGSSIVAVSTSDSITVDADNAFPDTYTLYISFVLNGFGYDDTISIVCQ